MTPGPICWVVNEQWSKFVDKCNPVFQASPSEQLRLGHLFFWPPVVVKGTEQRKGHSFHRNFKLQLFRMCIGGTGACMIGRVSGPVYLTTLGTQPNTPFYIFIAFSYASVGICIMYRNVLDAGVCLEMSTTFYCHRKYQFCIVTDVTPFFLVYLDPS